MIRALALKLDYAALYGVGTAVEPLGIKNFPGVDVTPIATDGAVPADYDFLSDAMFRVEDENGTPNAMIYSPRTGNTLRKMVTATEGIPLPMHPDVASLARYATNQIPNDLDEGTSTGVCSDLFLGDWSTVVIGLFADERGRGGSDRRRIGVGDPGHRCGCLTAAAKVRSPTCRTLLALPR